MAGLFLASFPSGGVTPTVAIAALAALASVEDAIAAIRATLGADRTWF